MTNFTTGVPSVATKGDITYPRVMIEKNANLVVLMLRHGEGIVLHTEEHSAFVVGEQWGKFLMHLMEDYNGTITFKCGDARDE